MTDKKSSGLTVKIDVDVAEAITGLKALQREAKKATQELRELETYYTLNNTNERFYVKWKQSHDDECTDIREVCMSDIPTRYLARELAKRSDGLSETLYDDIAAVMAKYVGVENTEANRRKLADELCRRISEKARE